MATKKTHGRPPMQQKQHPNHNMPSPAFDGAPLGMTPPGPGSMPIGAPMGQAQDAGQTPPGMPM